MLKMSNKLLPNLFKLTGVRLYNTCRKKKIAVDKKCTPTDDTNVTDDREKIDPPRKDPKVEVFGKAPRTGEESVEELENLKLLSTMPKELRDHRIARIYKRSKHVMQQGTNNTEDWIVDFGNEQRWENPNMGWCSSGDPISNMHMIFPSLCAAVCFAERQGLKWTHVKPQKKKEVKKSYADIFAWNRRTRASTK